MEPQTDDPNETANETESGNSKSAPVGIGRPIVVKSKKKKYRYSRGLKDLQRTGRSMTKVSSRLSRAVSKGVDTYRKSADKSARKKRDGAIRDFGLNAAKGLSKSLRASSRTPYDLARAINGPGTRKRIRRQLKGTSRFARLLRFR